MVIRCKNNKKLHFDLWPLFYRKGYRISFWRHVWLDCAHFALSVDMRFTCMSHRCIKNEKIESQALHYRMSNENVKFIKEFTDLTEFIFW